MYWLENRAEREARVKWWYKLRREAWKKMFDDMERQSLQIFRLSKGEADVREERNDVYIYKTLKYPPGTKQPMAE